jgi:hypothetical protein
MDLADLANGLSLDIPIDEIAEFLCRDVNEVRRYFSRMIPLPPPTSFGSQPLKDGNFINAPIES